MTYSRFLSARSNWIEKSMLAEVMKEAISLQKKGLRLISLAAGDPDPNVIPRDILGNLAKEILENEPRSVMYTPVAGIPELREEIANFLERYDSTRVNPENIVITTGGTGAIDLLGRVLIDPGDIVITENPTYINTLLALKQLGARVIGVSIRNDGINIEELEKKIKELKNESHRIKAIYTIPTGHNPMGITMSTEKRKELLEIAEKYDLLIIEDAAYNFMRFEGSEIKPIKALDSSGRVIVVGTLSKVLGTGFRIGWVIAKDEILNKIVMEKQPIDFCAPAISQFIALEYLRRNFFEKYHINMALKVYKNKRDTLIKALEENLGDLEFTKPIAGMFSMLFLPKNIKGIKFAMELMKSEGVVVVPGAPFYTDNSGVNTIRLNFSRPSQEDIREGVEKLARFLKNKCSS